MTVVIVELIWRIPAADNVLSSTCVDNRQRHASALQPLQLNIELIAGAVSLQRSRKSMAEPSPLVKVTVANNTLKTHVKPNTNNPTYEHNFEFLIHNPKLQDINMEVSLHRA